MWGISGVFTLALTVAKTSSNYDRFAIFVPARSLLLFDLAYQDGNVSGPKGWRGTRVNGGISRSQKHCYLRRKCNFDDLPLASTQLLRQKSFDNGTSMLGRSFNFDDKNSTLIWYPLLRVLVLLPTKLRNLTSCTGATTQKKTNDESFGYCFWEPDSDPHHTVFPYCLFLVHSIRCDEHSSSS